MTPSPSIVTALRRHAAERPHAPAFAFLGDGERESARMTYAQLDLRARSIAAALLARGLGGERVTLVYPSGLDLITAVFGCFYAGAIPSVVPVIREEGAFERAHAIARDAQAKAGLSRRQYLTASARELPAGVEWIAADEIADDPAAPPPVAVDPHALALLQYTSGSTASPRGVMISHANIGYTVQALVDSLKVDHRMIAASWLPLYHDMGLFDTVLMPVFAGGFTVLMQPLRFVQRPMRWLEAISRYRACFAPGPNFAFDLCVRHSTPGERTKLDLSCWTMAICGAEPIRPQALERFADVFAAVGFARAALLPAYGLAEITVLGTKVGVGESVITHSVDAPSLASGRVEPPHSVDRERRLVCCGTPRAGHEIAIVDPDTRRRVADGQAGEIWLRGRSVAMGYWRRPDETASVFGAMLEGEPDRGGWLRTGDLGFVDAHGLYISGRRKDLIIVRGTNFDPLDLETKAAESDVALAPGKGGAFAIDTEHGEVIVLVHEVQKSAVDALDAVAVTARVVAALTRAFGVSLHDLVLLPPGAVPRTTSGKIQRHLCRERYLSGTLQALPQAPNPVLGRWRPGGETH